MSNKMTRVILGLHGGEAEPLPAGGRMVEGVVHAFDAVEGVTFVIPVWDDGDYTFGPAPYLRGTTTDPAVDDRCLVFFVGQGIETPWVVGWWPA